MFFKGDIFCLKKVIKKDLEEVEHFNPKNQCPNVDTYADLPTQPSLCLDEEDIQFEWESLFSPISKALDLEIRKVDIFSLNHFKHFTCFYDSTKNVFVTSFLNKYIFLTLLK